MARNQLERSAVSDTKLMKKVADPGGQTYAAPALEKGLDILELLCRSETPLSQKDVSLQLGRSVGEIYRMMTCLVDRGYLANIDDKYVVTTKLFELAHLNPPTHRLLVEAVPIMQRLSSELDQSCHLTVYNQGRQIVIAKVDAPSGMGFSVRVGAELDVLVSASGRVLLAFQDGDTRKLRIEEFDPTAPWPRRSANPCDPRNHQGARLRVDSERSGARPLCRGFPDPRPAKPRHCRTDGALRRAHRPNPPQIDCHGRGVVGRLCTHVDRPRGWLRAVVLEMTGSPRIGNRALSGIRPCRSHENQRLLDLMRVERHAYSAASLARNPPDCRAHRSA